MTWVQARRQAATTVGNFVPQGPRSNASRAAPAASAPRGRIDRPQRRRERFPLLPIREIEAVAKEMDDTGLQRRRGKDRRERLAHAFEAVSHRNEDVLVAAGLQV